MDLKDLCVFTSLDWFKESDRFMRANKALYTDECHANMYVPAKPLCLVIPVENEEKGAI